MQGPKKFDRKPSSGLSRRIHFPHEEARLPWLAALLDCYAIADTGVAIAVRDAVRKEKKVLACGRDCDVCCHQSDIPLYPHEVPGLLWYLSEKVEPSLRDVVKHQLNGHKKGSPCPFLVDHSCSVHPLRPIACRQYNVLTARCDPGEDPYFSRRADVLAPPADYTDRAFTVVAAFYRMERDAGKIVRHVKGMIMNLQEYDWAGLAAEIEARS